MTAYWLLAARGKSALPSDSAGDLQFRLDLRSLEDPQPVGRAAAGLAAPGADVLQGRDELEVKLLHVRLVFDRGQGQPLALVLLELRQRLVVL